MFLRLSVCQILLLGTRKLLDMISSNSQKMYTAQYSAFCTSVYWDRSPKSAEGYKLHIALKSISES